MEDRSQPGLGHACGVFGVYAPGEAVAQLAYLGLYALQHRGLESAGIAVSDGETITVVKDMGLVTQVFDERRLAPLDGHLAIGHNRYSTTGSSTWRNAQPVYRSVGDAGFALGHNGNLTNTAELAERLGMLPGLADPGVDVDSTTDSALIAELVAHEYATEARSDGRDLEVALERVLPRLAGGFSLVLMDEAHLIAVRDRHGFWPLVLGRVEGGGWVVASETAALDILGAHVVREVEPGEMVVIDASGLREHRFADPKPSLCLFEFVYFARPDSYLYGRNVHAARRRMGEELARQAPVEADMVMPVPESGIPAAQGYAHASGIPYGDGLVKNRYVGRTFIQPSQRLRSGGVRLKLNPLPEAIRGKRLVVVEDSIVRGTTTRQVVAMLREAGAREVHLRISSPPYKWPCHYGMDTGRRAELLAADLSVGEIADYLKVDSLAYLELDRLTRATGAPADGFCTACLSGSYPVPVPVTLDAKHVLEASGVAGADEPSLPVGPTRA
ncbi:MAG TPA: amidophosphoribosyltransferase [Acidimicrobiia bacterium]|nr:amidophosphoribosyltransferase [Acidimicrobiia bacterium]